MSQLLSFLKQLKATGVSIEEVMEMDKRGELPRKLNRAVEKDTVTVPDGGYTILRFHATNPGNPGHKYRIIQLYIPIYCRDIWPI